jgi:hypothetical protein
MNAILLQSKLSLGLYSQKRLWLHSLKYLAIEKMLPINFIDLYLDCFVQCRARAMKKRKLSGSGGISPPFLTSQPGGRQWSASCPQGIRPLYQLDKSLSGPQSRSGSY